MKIYTRTGDDGTTGLFGGKRVRKDDVRVTAYGDVDETNAAIGLAAACMEDSDTSAALQQIQHDLFAIGARLATPANEPSTQSIGDADVKRMEQWIDLASDKLPPLTNFILPGGTQASAALHMARAVCRRSERAVVHLDRQEPVGGNVIVYLNRLGDLLFVFARAANQRAGREDCLWSPKDGA